jgi:hypothetical protein
MRPEWPPASVGIATGDEVTLASYAMLNFFKDLGEDLEKGRLFAWVESIIAQSSGYSEDGPLAQGAWDTPDAWRGEFQGLVDNARLWLVMSYSKKKGMLAPVQRIMEEKHSLILTVDSIDWWGRRMTAPTRSKSKLKSNEAKPYFTEAKRQQLRMIHILPALARNIKFNFKSMVEELERAEDTMTMGDITTRSPNKSELKQEMHASMEREA